MGAPLHRAPIQTRCGGVWVREFCGRPLRTLVKRTIDQGAFRKGARLATGLVYLRSGATLRSEHVRTAASEFRTSVNRSALASSRSCGHAKAPYERRRIFAPSVSKPILVRRGALRRPSAFSRSPQGRTALPRRRARSRPARPSGSTTTARRESCTWGPAPARRWCA
jgi:hypothetical protein